jgi:spoIIIJ-associated protein
MSEERATLEIIAPSVEEAIEDGLDQLGVTENQVDIEILDEGSQPMFGLGGRQARVRLTVKEDAVALPRSVVAPVSGDDDDEYFEDNDDEDYDDDDDYQDYDDDDEGDHRTHAVSVGDMDVNNTMAIARETVRELLERMRVDAEVSVRLGEPDDMNGQAPIFVDVNGNDLSYLIGRRAETLTALQYITRLIVGKELGTAAYIIVDVEGYRERREQTLQQMAEKMARQAIRTGETQILEPMNPADRRIVHIHLREFEGVSTSSVGEEPRRKVSIIPD